MGIFMGPLVNRDIYKFTVYGQLYLLYGSSSNFKSARETALICVGAMHLQTECCECYRGSTVECKMRSSLMAAQLEKAWDFSVLSRSVLSMGFGISAELCIFV